MTYALAAENLEELKTHENKRVEIIGRMSPSLTALPAGASERPVQQRRPWRMPRTFASMPSSWWPGSCDAK
jgi:hypothetical protein